MPCCRVRVRAVLLPARAAPRLTPGPAGYHGYHADCCEALTTPAHSCGCRGASLMIPGGVAHDNGTRYNATNDTWAKVDWPLDDICSTMYPGSHVRSQATLGRLPLNLGSFYAHIW